MNRLTIICALAAALLATGCATNQTVSWPEWGYDTAATKYSPLTNINRSNVTHLQQAWVWKTGETRLPQYGTSPGMFEDTPLMIGDTLYVTTPYNRVVALDPVTGVQRWTYDPKSYVDGQPPNGTGYVHRGVVAWSNGYHLDLFLNTRYRLICLDASTGKPVPGFGHDGVVDLSQGLIWPINKLDYTETSPPVIYKDLVIVGNGVGDRLIYHNDPPGDVRAFDAHTGREIWSFHTIPQAGEYGNHTWGDNAWKFTGHTNVWAPMTLDTQRGLLYLPVSTPSNDFYGGARPGDNLFGETLVCLNAATGKRVWDFQIVHHGLWDYDLASPPVLLTITVGGKKIDAVVQPTKEGFLFVFNRLTGKPVWPIVERAVPASNVPGEHASPSQPFPTKPPAYTAQGVTLDDAFNLTPQLQAQAQAQMKKYRLGPLFTPPSLQGTLERPGDIGGANWGGAAVDTKTGWIFIKSSNSANVYQVIRPDRSADNPRAAENTAEWSGNLTGLYANFDHGLPLTRPPYGTLTAIDLDTGSIAWQEPFGDNPRLRRRLTALGISYPHQLGIPGPQGPMLTAGGLLFVGSEDTALHAIDETNGHDLWQGKLPDRAFGDPMTYRTRDGRQFVLVATGSGPHAELVAFALPTK